VFRKNTKIMAKVKSAENAIKRITKYCKDELGFDVELTLKRGAENQCDPELNLITIVNKGRPHHIIWTLLHETGHAKVFTLSDYNDRYGQIAEEHERPGQKQSNLYRYQKLREEMLAWEVGLNIAKKLNIAVDELEYEKYAAKCYMSYVYLASQPYYQRAAKKAFRDAGYDLNFNQVIKKQ
jgi:hypothetical protein